MFRKQRQQMSLFDHEAYLPQERVEALEKTWAGAFRRHIRPLIDEDPFEKFYSKSTGRPNVPVAVLMGLCILKERHNLTDAELLGSLEWDIRWQYALGLKMDEADICQKTLHNFRHLVTTNRLAEKIFADITFKIVHQAGLATDRQRLDSTHITSNMANLSRLSLFVRTIEKFLLRLQKAHSEAFSKLPQMYREVYVDRAGYFADVKSSKARRRLEKTAGHLFDLVDRFRGDKTITHMRSYKLMARLLDEQCEIVQDEAEPVRLKEPRDISAESLQNPSDPDATYGHKGKGYKASLTETCDKQNPFQVITDVAVDKANQPDAKDVEPVLERLETAEAKPEVLFADAGYGSGENLLGAAGRGVELAAPMTSGSNPDEKKVRLDDFDFDSQWTRITACLAGHAPVTSGLTPNGKSVFAIFDSFACEQCPLEQLCPVKRHKNGTRRLRIPRKTAAAAARRAEQRTEAFKERYKIRSGIEATISETNRLTGFKRSWTRGRARVTTATFFAALAINVKRYVQSEMEKARKEARGPKKGPENVSLVPKSALQTAIEAAFRLIEPHFALAA